MEDGKVEAFRNGKVLLIDKELNWTSFDVVNKLRSALKFQLGIKKIKVGHAGTLDPLATGLLVVCTGKMTKQIETIQATKKVYTGEFTLGGRTASHDLEQEVTDEMDVSHITDEAIEKVISKYRGAIQQKPPSHSAVKIQGKRAYEMAREGIKTEIQPKDVVIEQFKFTRPEINKIRFEIICGKGTYIRSLARDIGNDLGCGAYLSELRRTAVGSYKVEEASSITQIINKLQE